MVTPPPDDDGDREVRDVRWVAQSGLRWAGTLSSSPPSRFRYGSIEAPKGEEGRDMCRAHNNARTKSGDSIGGGSSSRDPLVQRAFAWVAIAFCLFGLFVTFTVSLRSTSSPQPSPSSPSLLLSRSRTISSRKYALFSAGTGTGRGHSAGWASWPSLSSTSSPSLNVRVSNKYQAADHGRTQRQKKSTYPWEHIAEPHADTRLEVANVAVDGDSVTFR